MKFNVGANYLGARLSTAAATLAGTKYIEFWSSAGGWYNFCAGKYIVAGGTSSGFLKGDGSLDTTAYLNKAGDSMTGPFGIWNQANADWNITRGESRIRFFTCGGT